MIDQRGDVGPLGGRESVAVVERPRECCREKRAQILVEDVDAGEREYREGGGKQLIEVLDQSVCVKIASTESTR